MRPRHPKRAEIIRHAFLLYHSGQIGLAQLLRTLASIR